MATKTAPSKGKCKKTADSSAEHVASLALLVVLPSVPILQRGDFGSNDTQSVDHYPHYSTLAKVPIFGD
ncbi:uncharacterized protein A4U43_C08F19670 [Asparagus officinalis]|nr:uncharacterized protein A4U43_C08F19670 [Asparagus officinalis]